ncbi:MAG: sulfite exporter TauE/SafE family protein [Flavobacteriaceae bacterium]
MAAFAAFLLGVSKSGIKGIAVLIVTFLVIVYGARASTGILMPLLLLGDVFAITYYSRFTRWRYILKMSPWMFLGVLIGVFYGYNINEANFRLGMAFIILSSIGMMYYWDQKKSMKVPTHWSFAGLLGLTAGFTTMVGNLAGAFTNIYFLAQKLPKNEFIGTAAWLFFIINVFKLPFHIFIWETIQLESLKISMVLAPFVITGLYVGVKLVRIIKEDAYRKLILLFTAIGALIILFQ